jgi:hypothetical protein
MGSSALTSHDDWLEKPEIVDDVDGVDSDGVRHRIGGCVTQQEMDFMRQAEAEQEAQRRKPRPIMVSRAWDAADYKQQYVQKAWEDVVDARCRARELKASKGQISSVFDLYDWRVFTMWMILAYLISNGWV